MLVTVTSPVAQALRGLFRQADTALTRGAARNAAAGVAARHARVLEDARTLHELHRLERLHAAQRPGRSQGR